MRYLLSLITIVAAGCATTESGSDSLFLETVSNGQPLAGATCTVTTNGGTWEVTTPASVAIGPANGDLTVVCEKPGFRAAELTYRMPGGYGGPGVGLGIGGGSGGAGVGFGLSFPIGKRATATYPSTLSVEMKPV